MLLKSRTLHAVLHRSESVGHPIYFAMVAAFGHGPYVVAAGIMAIVALLLLVIQE